VTVQERQKNVIYRNINIHPNLSINIQQKKFELYVGTHLGCIKVCYHVLEKFQFHWLSWDRKRRKNEPSEKSLSGTEPIYWKTRWKHFKLFQPSSLPVQWHGSMYRCTGETDGTAKNLNHAMFQFFIFSITISLFSSIIATILIFSARVGIIELAGLSVKLVTPRTSLILTLEEPWLFVFIFSG